MLKNVVFPAPLGPMIETIDPTGMSIETSLTATQAAELLGHLLGAEDRTVARAVRGGAGASTLTAPPPPARRRPRLVPGSSSSVSPIPLVSSSFRRRSGIRPCGRSTITSTSRKPKMLTCRSVRLKFRPRSPGSVLKHVRDQVVVDVGEQQRAEHDPPDRAQAAEDHHREDEDREAELELAGVDQRRVGAQEGAGDAAERRAQRVGVAASCGRAGCPSRRPRPRPRAARSTPAPAASRARGC